MCVSLSPFTFVVVRDVDLFFFLEDDGKSYRGEEEFDNVALPWK